MTGFDKIAEHLSSYGIDVPCSHYPYHTPQDIAEAIRTANDAVPKSIHVCKFTQIYSRGFVNAIYVDDVLVGYVEPGEASGGAFYVGMNGEVTAS